MRNKRPFIFLAIDPIPCDYKAQYLTTMWYCKQLNLRTNEPGTAAIFAGSGAGWGRRTGGYGGGTGDVDGHAQIGGGVEGVVEFEFVGVTAVSIIFHN